MIDRLSALVEIVRVVVNAHTTLGTTPQAFRARHLAGRLPFAPEKNAGGMDVQQALRDFGDVLQRHLDLVDAAAVKYAAVIDDAKSAYAAVQSDLDALRADLDGRVAAVKAAIVTDLNDFDALLSTLTLPKPAMVNMLASITDADIEAVKK